MLADRLHQAGVEVGAVLLIGDATRKQMLGGGHERREKLGALAALFHPHDVEHAVILVE